MGRQIIAAAFLVFGLVVFVSLGVWQLQRLAWKQGVLAEIEQMIAGDPVALPADPDPEADRYLPVQVAGAMGTDELHVLVSSRDYGPGFRIIVPFITDDGRRIMIDRGYVPTELKDAPRDGGDMQVVGNLHWPDERDSYTPTDDPAGNWWYARDVARMAAALDTEPVLLIARDPTGPRILPLPVTTEGIANDHLYYAMTWFLLAVTWVMMTGFALWRIRRRTLNHVD